MRAALLAQMAAQRGGDIGRVEAASAHFSHSEESPAQMATEKEIEFAIGDHEVVELTAIEAALSRIEAGSYGECIACGRPHSGCQAEGHAGGFTLHPLPGSIREEASGLMLRKRP
jgi:hypothetical protein